MKSLINCGFPKLSKNVLNSKNLETKSYNEVKRNLNKASNMYREKTMHNYAKGGEWEVPAAPLSEKLERK